MERGFSRLSSEMDERIEALVESRLAADDRLDDHLAEQLDDRLTAVAKLIRSDNRVLAQQIAEAAPRSDGRWRGGSPDPTCGQGAPGGSG